MRIISLRIGGRNVSRLTINGRNVLLGNASCDALCFTAEEAGSTVKLHKVGSAPDVNLQTSTNGSSWTPYTVEDVITLANIGDKVYFKSVGLNMKMGNSAYSYNNFVMTGKIAASGNVNSLLEEDEETARTMSLAGRDQCYRNMFYNCTSLTKTPELPATTLASSCYEHMFENCASLTSTSELPATTRLVDYCYLNMFSGCTSLEKGPELPSITLAHSCYNSMFSGCTSLANAPELPATTLAQSCYENMFAGCTSLTQAPELPATTLASNCYERMFNNCTALTQAPELPATTLAGWCYNRMFAGCSSLTQAPTLPATELAENCYSGMFENCSSLTQAPTLQEAILYTKCYAYMFNNCTALTQTPELPSTTLADGCYLGMFSGCTALTNAPELPATTLANGCYDNMFNGSTNLNYVKVGFTNWAPLSATNGWLPDNTGTFECPQALIDNTTERTTSTVPASWTMVAYDVEPECLCFTAEEAGSTVLLTKLGNAPSLNLQTSTDGRYWKPYTIEDTITLTNIGDKVYFKSLGSNERIGRNSSDYNMFVMTGKIAASGNVNSLLEEDEETARTMSLAGRDNCYTRMFLNCSSLTQAPSLLATTLADNCYTRMFLNCSSLTQAPELPATTLNPYCYYSMFSGCTSLTQAPELPATILDSYCYSYMFKDCTSLTQAPELPAKTLFSNCYTRMFFGCTSLSSIKVAFIVWGSSITASWLDNVATTGTFKCPQTLIDNTTERTPSTVPNTWTMVAV